MKLLSRPRNLKYVLRSVGVLAIIAAVLVAVGGGDDSSGDPAPFETRTLTSSIGSQPAPPKASMDLEMAETSAETGFAPNKSSRIEDVVRRVIAEPVSVSIPAIGVEAPVVSSGVDKDTGQMEVPRSVSNVGWYEYGPSPGEPGSAVFAAHVDLAGQGRGVFFDLRMLNPGDRIMVEYDDSTMAWFTVAARTTYHKEDLPIDSIFARSGGPVLTLVTCGGGFDTSSSRYDSNVVVYAVPAAIFAPGSASSS